jgi:Leucine rich repeat
MMNLLKSIKLNNNTLEAIDAGVFADLKLEQLDLSSNRLWNDNFLWPVIDLEYLNLSFNEYQEINTSVLENVRTDFWGEMLARATLSSS